MLNVQPVILQEDYNVYSIIYTLELFDFLVRRSFNVESIKIKAKKWRLEGYYNYFDYPAYRKYLIDMYNKAYTNCFSGPLVIRVEELTLKINNLSRWNAYFDIHKISQRSFSINEIKNRHILNNFFQKRIDNEVEQYKRLLYNELLVYNDKINRITIPDELDESYVDPWYVNCGYVFPQIN